MVEDLKQFLIKMKKIELYLVKLKTNRTIKEKNYFLNYIVKGKNCWPIIVITYNECTFFANNDF